jgi:hypothetical protein
MTIDPEMYNALCDLRVHCRGYDAAQACMRFEEKLNAVLASNNKELGDIKRVAFQAQNAAIDLHKQLTAQHDVLVTTEQQLDAANLALAGARKALELSCQCTDGYHSAGDGTCAACATLQEMRSTLPNTAKAEAIRELIDAAKSLYDAPPIKEPTMFALKRLMSAVEALQAQERGGQIVE